MKNAYAIGDMAGTMARTCDTVVALSLNISTAEQNDNTALVQTYTEMILNELENIQRAVLSLTELVSDSFGIREDSAFFAGELNDELGDKTDKDANVAITVEPEKEDK